MCCLWPIYKQRDLVESSTLNSHLRGVGLLFDRYLVLLLSHGDADFQDPEFDPLVSSTRRPVPGAHPQTQILGDSCLRRPSMLFSRLQHPQPGTVPELPGQYHRHSDDFRPPHICLLQGIRRQDKQEGAILVLLNPRVWNCWRNCER